MPDGWRKLPLLEAAEVTIGRQRSPKTATGPQMVPYLRAANVKDGRLALHDVLKMNFDDSEQEVYGLKPGDVLVSEGCGSIRELGASAAWHGPIEGTVCFQNTLLRLRAIPEVTLPSFLEHWARWAHGSGIWASIASGTNIFHIGALRARTVPILLPPLSAQRRIADLAQAVDDLVLASRNKVRATELARDTLLADLLKADGGDQEVALGAVATVRGGKRLPKGTPWSVEPTEHRYIRATDIAGGHIDEGSLVHVPDDVWPRISRYTVDTDDVLITIAGTIGSVARVPPSLASANLTENAALIRADRSQLDPAFLELWLQSPPAQAQITSLTVGTTQRKLALFRIESIQLPLIALEAQRRIAALIDSVNAAGLVATRLSDGGLALRRAIMADLMTGNHNIPDSYDELLERAS